MSVQAFPFEKLPRVSWENLEAVNALEKSAKSSAQDKVFKSISELLKTDLGSDVRLSFESYEDGVFSSWIDSLPKQGFFLTMNLLPQQEKGVIFLDLVLVKGVLDRLLGSTKTDVSLSQEFSEIEEGLISYFMMKVFQLVYQVADPDNPIHFRLDEILSDKAGLLNAVGSNPGVGIRLNYKIKLGSTASIVSLLLPNNLARGLFVRPRLTELSHDDEVMRKRIKKMEGLTFPLSFELGKSIVPENELRAMEPGDVLLLEETEVKIFEGKLRGKIKGRIGQGEGMSLKASIVSGDGPVSLRVETLDVIRSLEALPL